MYTKTVNGRQIFDECLAIQTVEGWWISNPTPEQIADAGWVPVPPHVRTLEEAINEKLDSIGGYNNSPEIKSFTINGNSYWMDPLERTNSMSTIQSAKRIGLETVYIFGIEMEPDIAIFILDTVNVYEMHCTQVTDTHKNNVALLSTIEEVDEYNNETGYPEKPSFQA